MEIPKFRSIDPCLPAGSQIFEGIKYAILKMDLPPGQLISESDIAEQFGASRTPVREAMQELRSVGLLMTKPSRGNFVTLLSRESILEARFLREAIEVANVARICSQPPRKSSMQDLEQNLSRQSAAVEEQNERLFSELDDEFHLIIARATGYPRVASVLEREKVLLDRLRVLSLNKTSQLNTLLAEHTQIFDALKANDTQRAVEATRFHLRSILTALSFLMERHADYFEGSAQQSSAGPIL